MALIDKRRGLRRLEQKLGRIHMDQDRLQRVLNAKRGGSKETELFDDVALPIWPSLELGLCGGMIRIGSTKKVKFVGWSVIDIDIAQTIGNHHGLYEHIQNSVEYHNPSASENMASILGLDPTFSMLLDSPVSSSSSTDTDMHTNNGSTTKTTKLEQKDFYDAVNSVQSRNWSMSRIKLGNKENKAARFKQAIQWYNQAITLDPSYADAYVARGSAFANWKQYDKAIADFEKALKVNSDVENGQQYLNNVKEAKRMETAATARNTSGSVSVAASASKKSTRLWPGDKRSKKKRRNG